ncbi:CYTH domain-containing protein [Lactobacillus hominis]|uniref:Adenylate cyclase n=1 Tax=Lactobacillus hominis DSM 23910 = CRBIP 24.179 TaxID=1423758 RepID=I7JUU0_9LACO|nr:CYTH domain-containing protein [Lactobacillus hominis]MCT3347930.1 CYTH domain-containing protein [Lactobacillus hominis]CCI81701.1 Adenylate cyclase [Lactobacillus hominis DSM 23910 = CRBIP 24.179]
MTKNIEIESKTLITQDTYEKMVAAFAKKSEYIQQNFYFDTPNLDLANNYSSVRIRVYVEHAEQTLKAKEKDPKQNKYHEVVEINDLLPLAQAEQMVHAAQDKEHFTFGGDVGNYLNKHFDKEIVNTLELRTWSKTRRIMADGPDKCDLTLDLTEYEDGFCDFELEIENDDPSLIKKVLGELQKQFNFKSTPENTNQNKVERAFTHSK